MKPPRGASGWVKSKPAHARFSRERDNVDRERRPIAYKRDPLQILTNDALRAIAQANAALAELNDEAINLRAQIVNANGAMKAQLQNRLLMVQNEILRLNRQNALNEAGIQKIAPELQTLNALILPLDQRLAKLWSELCEARKQWLALRQPIEKYARGEFELLRRFLDDWLLIDGLWPSAFTWAALWATK